MTTPDSCPTCGLALNVHGCTPERCGNPICVCGHHWHTGECRECGCGVFVERNSRLREAIHHGLDFGEIKVGADGRKSVTIDAEDLVGDVVRKYEETKPSDLDVVLTAAARYRFAMTAMPDATEPSIGQRWQARADFSRIRVIGDDGNWIVEDEVNQKQWGLADDELRRFYSFVPSDIDVFRAMLERAGVRFEMEPAQGTERNDLLFGDAVSIRCADNGGDIPAMVTFVFHQKTGSLLSARIWGNE